MQNPNIQSFDYSTTSNNSYEQTDDYLKFINFQSSPFSGQENSNSLFYADEKDTNNHMKLFQKSKRIMKREQAKKRTKEKGLVNNKKENPLDESKDSEESEKTKTIKDITEENDEDLTDLSEKDKKKMQQKIRNRVSAQQSRDRKKVYIVNLEQQNSVLLSENVLLKQDLIYMKQENEQLKEENFYLKSQLNHKMGEEVNHMIAIDTALDSEASNNNYLSNEDNTTNNTSYASPFHPSNGSPKNLFKYGLALLSIISMVMIFGMNVADNKEINIYKKTEPGMPGTNLMLLEKNYDDLIELSRYPNLKYLNEYRREIMNKILVLKEKENPNVNSIVRYDKSAKFLGSNSEENNETQLVLFSENQDLPLSTLFCPSTYIYQPVKILNNFVN